MLSQIAPCCISWSFLSFDISKEYNESGVKSNHLCPLTFAVSKAYIVAWGFDYKFYFETAMHLGDTWNGLMVSERSATNIIFTWYELRTMQVKSQMGTLKFNSSLFFWLLLSRTILGLNSIFFLTNLQGILLVNCLWCVSLHAPLWLYLAVSDGFLDAF